MASDTPDPQRPSRRDFLRATGAGVLAASLAGCDELPDEANDTADGGTGTGTNGGTAAGTATGSGEGEGEGNPLVANPYAVDTTFTAEREGLVQSTFAEEYYTPLEEIPGVDAPEDATPTGHAVTYGHEMAGPGASEEPPTLRRLAAGVVSLPAPGGGVNTLVDAPLTDLVAQEEGNLLLAAAGLGRTVEWVGAPVPIEGGNEEAPRSGTVTVEIDGENRQVEVRTFVGAVRAEPGPDMPAGEDDSGFFGDRTVPGNFMMTVHVGRTVVGGDLVMTGMGVGWPRPPGTIDPPPSEMDDDIKELLADAYEKVVKAALFVSVLGEKGMLAAALMPDEEELERRRPNEEVVERSYSATVGLDDDDQVELGYPEEDVHDGHMFNSFTLNRDMPGLFSGEEYDPEEHSKGTSYLVKVDSRTTTYPVEGEDGRTIPVGVVASPLVEVEGEERNEMATTPLADLFDFASVPFDAVRLAGDFGSFDFDLGVGSELERLSSETMLGESGDFGGFEVQLGDLDGNATGGTLYAGRITTADEVVVAVAFSQDGGGGHFDEAESVKTVFQEAVQRVLFDPDTPSNWVDASIDDLTPVQIVRNTRLETASGDVLGQSDPPLVEGRNTAAPFDVSTWSGTAFSSYADPIHGVFTFDVGSRSSDFQTVLEGSSLTDLDQNNVDPDMLFDGNRQDSNADNDLPVFELRGDDDSVTLKAHAPSGHVYDTRTVNEGSDYSTTGMDVLRVGFITIVDPEDGTNYGDGNGEPVDYEETVEMAFEYLRRTYPTGLAVYRHDDAIEGITFALNDNATQNETKDYRNARVALERIAKPGNNNWSYSGDTWGHGISDSEARSQIRSNGFDVWVMIAPNGYYNFHRDGRPSGLAPWNDDLAVIAVEGARNGRASAAETTAQEIGHRIERSPYQSPTSGAGMQNPLAQRDDDGTNTANRDFDHARHLSSNNDGNTPTDAPGVVSRGYSLADGEFVVPNATRWNGGFDIQSISNFPAVTSGYGPGSDTSRLGRLEGYMSYSGRWRWTDSVITQDIVESDFNRESGNYQTTNVMFGGLNQVNLSTSGAEPGALAAAEPTLTGLQVERESVTSVDEERVADAESVATVTLFGPDGTEVARRQVSTDRGLSGDGVEGEHLEGDAAFAIEFPPDAVEMAVETEAGPLTVNPITAPIREAHERLPPEGMAEPPDAIRERLNTLLGTVDAEMGEGNYGAARDALVRYAEQGVPAVIAPEFEPRENQFDRARLQGLLDEMIGRLDGLAGGTDDEVDVGEAPDWSGFVPTPDALPALDESRVVWQYDVGAVLTGGDIESKAELTDPMANPFVGGLAASLSWVELAGVGIAEAVVGDAARREDVDPAAVPADEGLLFGNAQVYLGSFDVEQLDEIVAKDEFSETETAGVTVHEPSGVHFAYGAEYVVVGDVMETVATLLATAAGEVDRWADVDEEFARLLGTLDRETADFALAHLPEDTVAGGDSTSLIDLSPFDGTDGIVQGTAVDGQTFTDASAGVLYPPETSPELDRLRETLGVDADDREFAREGRLVTVRASYDGPL